MDAAVIDRVYNDGMNLINQIGQYAQSVSTPGGGSEADAAQLNRLRIIANSLLAACDQAQRIAQMAPPPPQVPPPDYDIEGQPSRTAAAQMAAQTARAPSPGPRRPQS